jgi:hypothetical protein
MIKITKDDELALIIHVISRREKGAGIVALFLIGISVVQFFLHRKVNDSRLIGPIGAALTCGLFYLVAYEESVFTFDSRKRSFSEKRGTLSFSRIEHVILQSVIYNKNYYHKYRVMLFTEAGDIPLSIAYEHNEINQAIAERIRSRLGFSPETLVTDSVKALVERGLDSEAIRLLWHKRGLPFIEAKANVEEIKAGKNRSGGN